MIEDSQQFDRINQALFIDLSLLLPGNNLVKPDRMGMAASIENRSPFLDHNLIELAFNIPGKLKLKNNETKYILKKSIEGLIGPELTYRKKQMFTVPISDWLKTDLKDTVYDLLYSSKSISRDLFNFKYVKKLYDDHCNDIRNNTREIRALMALEIWFRQFIDDEPNVITLNTKPHV
jgi:asparagine synthase (glutamine-hydrolysing)